MKHLMSLAVIGPLAAGTAGADVLSGQAAPLYTVPGTFRADAQGNRATLHVLDGQGGGIGKYDLSGCRFRDGDGAFALLFPGAQEPMVAVICHLAEGGQQISVLAPERDTSAPILELAGDSFVRHAIRLGGLEVTRDSGGDVSRVLWHPGAEADESELAWVREHLEAAAGQRMVAPGPVSDPEFRALAVKLSTISETKDAEALVALASPEVLVSFGGNGGVDEFRETIAYPGFWPDFARVLEGGGVLTPGWGEGRAVVFPAAFHTWPDELDVFGHYYGDRAGAQMRAGPSEDAPVLADLHGRIVARGPYLEGEQELYEDGWLHVCTVAEGCGFARSTHMRSPIDWRAIFTQAEPGAPWVLQTYVAGD